MLMPSQYENASIISVIVLTYKKKQTKNPEKNKTKKTVIISQSMAE